MCDTYDKKYFHDHSFKQVFRNTLKKIIILSFISKCNKIMGRVQDKVILVSAAGNECKFDVPIITYLHIFLY